MRTMIKAIETIDKLLDEQPRGFNYEEHRDSLIELKEYIMESGSSQSEASGTSTEVKQIANDTLCFYNGCDECEGCSEGNEKFKLTKKGETYELDYYLKLSDNMTISRTSTIKFIKT